MNFKETIQKCILQVRKECVFFGALMLFAEVRDTKKIPTAATDGLVLYFNEDFLFSLSSSEQNALMLHEVLHMALLHVSRRESRDPHIWNIAADIVVNDLIQRNTNFKLPKDAIIDNKYSDKSVEYIYEKLLKDESFKRYKLAIPDIATQIEGESSNAVADVEIANVDEIEGYWKDKLEVLKNNYSEDGSDTQGSLPGGISQEINSILEPEVDWRHALWKFVGKTPADFDDIDRRFIYKGLYLEGLLTESIELSVCIDTSGSISGALLDQFIGELQGILRSYPHVKCNLYWADTEVYGPYELSKIEDLPSALGFGGTSFVPFFNKVKKDSIQDFMNNNRVSIYFTDGYGNFPDFIPNDPVMWLVSKDGLETSDFPFGEVIRISTESF
jgi:predicted metal-dependent peptidase